MSMSLAAATRVITLRNYLTYRHGWWIFLTGFLEPVLFLFSIGVGVGALVGGFEVGGRTIPYAEFVAPALLATSAMNGALLDATFNTFFKLKYQKVYDQMLATPLTPVQVAVGELVWCLLRSGIYSAVFLLVMWLAGTVHSWTAVLALPAAVLIGFAVAAVGLAATTFMKSWQDFEFISLVTMPMFLFSATFFPLSAYPTWLAWIVECTPLYRGVVLCRELTTGQVTLDSLVSVVYLLVLGGIGMSVVGRRLEKLLLT